MHSPSLVRRSVAGIGAIVLAAALAACGSDDDASSDTSTSPEASTSADAAISAERCAENEAAGKITYMSGYYWQASASILEVVAADQLGYFKDLCLDVELQPGQGDTSVNTKLVQSGQVQIGPLSEQDIITANASTLENGGEPKLLGVSSYSNSGLDILMTMPDITDLTQIEGLTAGQKGYVPLSVAAMLGEAGVDNDKVNWVKVGYDPTILPRGEVQALTGFVSNEPNLLKDAGEEVTVWTPSDYGVPGSLGAYAVNADWAAAHPTALEDFLRASFKAFAYCSENVDECIGYQQTQQNDPTDAAAHEKDVWTTESGIVAQDPVPTGWGTVDLDNVKALTDIINTYMGMTLDPAVTAAWFTNDYASKVVNPDGSVIWPAE